MFDLHHHRKPTSIKVAFIHHHHHPWLPMPPPWFPEGEHIMPIPGPITLVDGTSTPCSIIVYDQYKAQMPTPDGTTVVFSDDNTTAATETTNPDNATGIVTAVGIGVANISAVASVPGAVGPLSASEPVTCTAAPSVPTSIDVAFG